MKAKRILAGLMAGAMLFSTAAFASGNPEWTAEEAEMAAWAEANGFVYQPEQNGYTKTQTDAITSATEAKAGGVNYGAIEWDTDLQVTAIKEFLKGGKYLGSADFAQDETGNNYREMFQLATSYNNIPTNTNLEMVLDASTLHLLGASEAGTAKTTQFKLNPNVSVSWVKQLRVEEEDTYNYYCSYGVEIDGQVRVYGPEDLATEEGQDALINLFDKYYPTLASTWMAYGAGLSSLTDPAEIRAAKLAYITKSVSSGSMVIYEIIPTRIVITAPFLMNMSPQMINAAQFTQVLEGEQKYAYTLGLSDSFLDKLIAYKNAYMSTEEGMAAVTEYYSSGMYVMLDQYCAAYGAPTSLQLAQIPTNAAGLKTQTTYIPE